MCEQDISTNVNQEQRMDKVRIAMRRYDWKNLSSFLHPSSFLSPRVFLMKGGKRKIDDRRNIF